MKQTKTTKITGGADYAKVADRIKMFRTDCPNGSIKSVPTFMDDGQVMFTTEIIKDLSDPNSARSNGNAVGTTKGKKEFEKLESIAVGRALAMLGYMADGEIATSEEMEEFQKYQLEKKAGVIADAIDKLSKATNREELQEIWKSLGIAIRLEEVVAKKDELKATLK